MQYQTTRKKHLQKIQQAAKIYLQKVTVKELYLISFQHETNTPISQKYFESMFQDFKILQWKHIYTLLRIITIVSKLDVSI